MAHSTGVVPEVAIYSLFRDDNEEYVNEYFDRVEKLDYPNLSLYLVEGDSVIPTHQFLIDRAKDCKLKTTVLKHDTGIGRLTTDRTARLLTLSRTANVALDAIKTASKIMLLESDILYESDLVSRLSLTDGVVAPTIKRNGLFYDVWAFRYADEKHIELSPEILGGLHKMFSVGSVVMYPAKLVYDGFRFDKNAIVGLCMYARDKGYQVYWNQDIEVTHPLRNVSTGL